MNQTSKQISMIVVSLWHHVVSHASLCALLVAILTTTSVCIAAAMAKRPRVHPAQATAEEYCAYSLMDRFEQLSSLTADHPGKDKEMRATRKRREPYEFLKYELGPMEIVKDEKPHEATRVVVPMLSATERNRSTGEITVSRNTDGQGLLGIVLEKHGTGEECTWRVVSDTYGSDWYKLPRKKVAGSPTIVMKKAVVVQILDANDTVTEQKIIYFDK